MKKNMIIWVVSGVLVVLGLAIFLKPKNLENVRSLTVMDKTKREEIKANEMIDTGMTYIQAQEYEEAKKVWKDILTKYPKTKFAARALYELGRYYEKINKENLAVENYLKIEQECPTDAYMGYALFELAKIDEKNNNLTEALVKLKKVKNEFFFIPIMEDVSAKADDINIKLLLSPAKMPNSLIYKVQPGDTIFGIAKKYNTTIDYIMQANGFAENQTIHPGQKIKLLDPATKFSVIVDKSQKSLFLKMNGEVIKTYAIAIGRNNGTPEGQYSIINKLKDPVWFSSGKAIAPNDPKNILGSRWMGFLNDLGIHGTTESKAIRNQETSGCIRMYNKDVEQLYKILRVGDAIVIQG